MKGTTIFLFAIGGAMLLTGCRDHLTERQSDQAAVSETDETDNSTAEAETDTVGTEPGNSTLSAEREDQAEENAAREEQEEQPEQIENEINEINTPKEAPRLPGTGSRLADFVPDGWELLDSVEMDFNEDGVSDYVGVLQAVVTDGDGYRVYQLGYPRILFAVAGEGKEGYRLDFQDENVIRKRDEGGVYGDPYQPLTVEGTSFTTHTYGGSAWRWSEDYTYTYREGIWWLASTEETYGYGEYITDYAKNDWDSGVGIRKERSSDRGPMEENFELSQNGEWESVGYDLEYEVLLDAQMTLEQAGKRWWLAPDRVTDWEVKEKVIGPDVVFPEEMTKLPDKAYINYCDEDRVLYIYHTDENSGRDLYYLVMYGLQDKVLSVLAEEEYVIEYPKFYEGKIYYISEIVENVTYRTEKDGKEEIREEEDTVGIRLNRMEPDGTGKEVIFEYRYPETASGILDSRLRHISLIYEINGGEIIAEVYLGGESHPFYRMKTDGSGQVRIGQVPK